MSCTCFLYFEVENLHSVAMKFFLMFIRRCLYDKLQNFAIYLLLKQIINSSEKRENILTPYLTELLITCRRLLNNIVL